VNIGHGIKGKRPLIITNLTSLSPGATGVHSRSSLSNRNQARRNVYMCVCVWRTKKRTKEYNHLTDDGWLSEPCSLLFHCFRGYIYIQQYNTHTHGQIFFFLGSKKERGTAVQVLLLFKKKIYTRRQTIGSSWRVLKFLCYPRVFRIILSVFVLYQDR
jgi:hypothetical protein